MKKTLVTTAIAGIAIAGATMIPLNFASCAQEDKPNLNRTFHLDEKMVERVRPNYEDCTVTVYLKNGKSKTFPFDWDMKGEFESKAEVEFIKIEREK